MLQEDREKLMQKRQPRFTEEQKKELAEVHSWVQKGVLPKAINITVRTPRLAGAGGGGKEAAEERGPYLLDTSVQVASYLLPSEELGLSRLHTAARACARDGGGGPRSPERWQLTPRQEPSRSRCLPPFLFPTLPPPGLRGVRQ